MSSLEGLRSALSIGYIIVVCEDLRTVHTFNRCNVCISCSTDCLESRVEGEFANTSNEKVGSSHVSIYFAVCKVLSPSYDDMFLICDEANKSSTTLLAR